MQQTIDPAVIEQVQRHAAAQKRRRQAVDAFMRVLAHVVLLLLSFMALIPAIWMISSSLKAPTEIFVTPIKWIPDRPQWSNYPRAFELAPLWLYFANTMIVCVIAVIGTTLSSCLVAYSFSRLRWPGRNFFFGLLLTTMMLPAIILIVPRFLMFSYVFVWPFKWIGTFLPLVVPTFFAVQGLYVFLLRQFFLGIPVELEDAARIDGASTFRILWQIFIPLSKPVLITVVILTFIQFYNEFLEALIYLKPATWTLAVGIRALNDAAYATSWEIIFATGTFMLAPLVILFFAAQRYFVEGNALTGFGGR
ncbi:MAG: carbohydrate ABC transporter permease [Caldilineaceae bacterium]|nr:carbohydrate ABC transporter permease [Caldilineaceae bacterium]